jgi:hypothetical protein
MRKDIRHWVTAALCAASAACGSQHEARQPSSETSAAKEEDESQSPGASKSEPGEESANRGIAEICEKLNQRASQKCTKQVAGLYRTSCKRYVKTPGHCEKEIRLALQCQYKAADDVLCAHQADPNCSQANRDLKVCERGTAPVEQTTAEDLTLPSGWAKVSDTQLGFTVAMPQGATLDAKSEHRTWQAEEGGISYYVAALDPPSGKLNNQAFVRTVIAYVGNRCQLRLKLHGELDIKGTTVVLYDSACPDGTEWHGMLHFWNGKAVSTGFHAPAGAKGVLEPYFYSFLIANP